MTTACLTGTTTRLRAQLRIQQRIEHEEQLLQQQKSSLQHDALAKAREECDSQRKEIDLLRHELNALRGGGTQDGLIDLREDEGVM